FISVCVPQRYGFASAHDLDSANDVSQFGLLERCAFNVIENSVTFSERQYRTTSPTLWRAARFHVRIGWHHRQNNLSIYILKEGLEDRISRVPFDSDLTTLGKIIDATGHNRMAARNHDIVTMGRYIGIKNATVLIAQNYETIFSIPTRSADQALQQGIKVRRL